ncbi:dienelactone hydrolase family protein [Sphaerotilus sp.]|uniref:dienelactone hydrolase family protein n=1 Tax=Sphaerotilus sp. TaxID=2093942 RepID=UPI0034E19B41
MERMTARDFDPAVLKLFDQYVHGQLSRRGFLDGAARYAATAGTSAAGLLAALSPRFAQAQQVSPQDPRIRTSRIEVPSPQGHGVVKGLLAQPVQAVVGAPSVLVIHENRGLNPYIEDVARRFAIEGFTAFAPDALAPLGGYPGDEDKARDLFPKLDQARTREDFVAAHGHLVALAGAAARVGAVGFCYGGTVVNYLATRLPELAAGVPFYGGQPPVADVARIRSPLLLHYAGDDERINAGWPAYDAALKAAGVAHEAHVYPGVQHGFHNDTTPRYDAASAKLAWERTLVFFRRMLSA